MSIVFQWFVTGLIILAALYYVFYRFGWLTAFNVKPPASGPCGHCSGCDSARKMTESRANGDGDRPS